MAKKSGFIGRIIKSFKKEIVVKEIKHNKKTTKSEKGKKSLKKAGKNKENYSRRPVLDFFESVREADEKGEAVGGSGYTGNNDMKVIYGYKVKTGLSKGDFKQRKARC